MIESNKLLLASRSPRRKDLLGALGIELIILPADIDESRHSDESPSKYVSRMSSEKAYAIKDSPHCILAADTIVVLNGEILGKPADETDAIKMWQALSGKWHTVITSYAIISASGEFLNKSISTQVKFKELSQNELEAYVVSNEWRDKAAGYAVQGISAFWVERIEGSYTNVVGLPVTDVSKDLLQLNPGWPAFPWGADKNE
jgi:nucleoside triphosphate pyrophosphatase